MELEVKFRGTDINGIWRHGMLVKDKHQSYILNINFLPALSLPSAIFEEVIPETVGQFTGLVDKNKNDIYHGDIIRSYGSQNNEILHVVKYDIERAGFCAEFIPYDEIGINTGIRQSWINEFEKEIIGNMHQEKFKHLWKHQ